MLRFPPAAATATYLRPALDLTFRCYLTAGLSEPICGPVVDTVFVVLRTSILRTEYFSMGNGKSLREFHKSSEGTNPDQQLASQKFPMFSLSQSSRHSNAIMFAP